MTEAAPRRFGSALTAELTALLIAGLAAETAAPEGGGQWLANSVFALLLFAFAMGTRIGRLVPMRSFLAAALLLLPLIFLTTIGLLIANEGIGSYFLDLVLRIGFLSGGAGDASPPVLLVIWWASMMAILIAALGARSLVTGFLLD